MKKIMKTILTLAILLFASISLFNCSYAENEVTTSGDAASLISTQNTAANQTNTQITTTVSSTSSADEGLLSPTNIINILLIAVGVVLVLLGIAILTKIGKSK